MQHLLRRLRRALFSDLIREHQLDRNLSYFLSLPDQTIRITHMGHEVRLFIPDADRDTVQRKILESRGFFEQAALTRVRELVPIKGRVVVDVGANIGNHSVYLTTVAGARRCHAFEPNPYARTILQKNVKNNDLEGTVEVHAVGIAAAEGAYSFDRVRGSNIGSNSFKRGGDDGIAFSSLDSFKLDDLALLKIDVEGMADEVLAGADATIRKFRPAIFVELIGEEAGKAMPILSRLGYRLSEVLPDHNYLYVHSGHA